MYRRHMDSSSTSIATVGSLTDLLRRAAERRPYLSKDAGTATTTITVRAQPTAIVGAATVAPDHQTFSDG